MLNSSCRKAPLQENIYSPTSSLQDTTNTILGKKLENPYTLQNMRKAYTAITTSNNTKYKILNVDNPVRLTHKYIRFLPKDTLEYDRLVRDTILKLYNTPLDYEIAIQGNYYHDPTVKYNLYTWLYASVPEGHALLPDIQHQFLDSLYIPEEDPLLNTTSNTVANTKTTFSDNDLAGSRQMLINNLLNQAMTQTHNYEYINNTNNKLKTLSYNPQGNITTYDTLLKKLVPLQGVRIRMKRWFTTRIVETDANGNYKSATTFSGPVNYYLFFETSRFDIRTGWFGQASINGPKQTDPWNVTIWPDDINRFYADVFRGAYRYWYGDIGGLYRPTLVTAIKYAARDNNTNTSTHGVATPSLSVFGVFPQIYISRRLNGRITDSDENFTTTVHETAHYTHYRNMLKNFKLMNSMIRESWATAVELYITKKEYQAKGITNYGEPVYFDVSTDFFPTYRGYQLFQVTSSVSYTPLFIDLVDNNNQFQSIGSGNNGALKDNITGYNMPALESYLALVENQNDLRFFLKNHKPVGVTDVQLDDFLSQFKF